jgi:chromosome segregation ATPase
MSGRARTPGDESEGEGQVGEHGIRDRLSSAGEDALGELAHNLLENPVFNQALATALGAGERALQAQRSALTALNIPSGSDLERLERRLRSVSDRLEEIEDRLDDVAMDLGALRKRVADAEPGEPTPDRDRLRIPDPGE